MAIAVPISIDEAVAGNAAPTAVKIGLLVVTGTVVDVVSVAVNTQYPLAVLAHPVGT